MLYQFGVGCGFGVWRHFQQYISQYIVGVSFIGIGDQETGENHRPTTSYWPTLSYIAYRVHRSTGWNRTHNFNGDGHWSHVYIQLPYDSIV